uniref:Protein ARV n=1 Tax=Drosophila melanogaster TaxID=7227 RepID=B7Z097_DROME|nr:ACAT-related protein required for viability 1, isoform C [Drosophila melanogaster]ACL83350.1 ACAT-related protein required for viability 1, isoform C [Drosophila melanogaster]|eukprot:NP_001137995.1 ACAT-related protein required for viability 1, isoform C [Drosophila melanogaster]
MSEKKRFVCVNCGHRVKELFKKYSNTMKTTQCDNCHQITDKYIEFEEFIILIDALLLDSCAFRHIIYNGDFKVTRFRWWCCSWNPLRCAAKNCPTLRMPLCMSTKRAFTHIPFKTWEITCS